VDFPPGHMCRCLPALMDTRCLGTARLESGSDYPIPAPEPHSYRINRLSLALALVCVMLAVCGSGKIFLRARALPAPISF